MRQLTITQKAPQKGRIVSEGFALIATLSVLVLLALLAVGILSLSTIQVRASSQSASMDEARANARMAMVLALAELQKELGPDQRISADASILDSDHETEVIDGVAQPGLLGVWDSWSPSYTSSPQQTAPDYAGEKTNRFRRWLVSSPGASSSSVEQRAYALSAPALGSMGAVNLYSAARYGRSVEAPLVATDSAVAGQSQGALAWHVRQENTRAEVVSHAYDGGLTVQGVDELMAPTTATGYRLSPSFKDEDVAAVEGLDKLIDFGQLDISGNVLTEAGYDRAAVWGDFTVYSAGLQTDVVKGGLKKDLSLGFELGDADFGTLFNGSFVNGEAGHANYGGQKNLYEPIVTDVEQTVDEPILAGHQYTFRTAQVPTFDTLRSHHRLYRHLYTPTGSSEVTAYERPLSHVTWGGDSKTRLRPVLDRVLLYFSFDTEAVAGGAVPRLIITPVVTLWNPLNVALECDGFDIYPSIDFPFKLEWTVTRKDDTEVGHTNWLSNHLTSRNDTGNLGTGYFHMVLTNDGQGTGTNSRIHFRPGEVKVFCPLSTAVSSFDRLVPDTAVGRQIQMLPVAQSGGGFIDSGGIAIDMQDSREAWQNYPASRYIMPDDKRLKLKMTYLFDTAQGHNFPYNMVMEDLSRLRGGAAKRISQVQVLDVSGLTSGTTGGNFEVDAVIDNPHGEPEAKVMSVQQTYHRTAASNYDSSGSLVTQSGDLFYGANPRQTDMSLLLLGDAGTSFNVAPHYSSEQFETSEIPGEKITLMGDVAFYGESNSASGRAYLPAFEVPRRAPMSLASLAHADVANTTYGVSYQIGNALATPYLARDQVARIETQGKGRTGTATISPSGFPIYDHSYLLNEVLWDGFFYSSVSPETSVRTRSGSAAIYDADQVNVGTTVDGVISDFVNDPEANPLRNRRYLLHQGGDGAAEVIARLSGDAGFREMARHLLVDGAFNVNSTSVAAWTAVLGSARGAEFEGMDLPSGAMTGRTVTGTPMSRMHQPVGVENDLWVGFRSLSDAQVEELAEKIVKEVKERGPFLSLAEFVNRRVEESPLGSAGAIQAAINATDFNVATQYATVDTSGYPFPSNYVENSTGVATPGYLTQADVLGGVGNLVTVRSDTFTIRAYGDARDAGGVVQARVWCEAVVQRFPEFVDESQSPSTEVANWNAVNATLGRKFRVISFRYLEPGER